MFINITKRTTETSVTISGSYNGKPFGVRFDQAKYDKMMELQRASLEVSSMEELDAIYAAFEPLTKESYKEAVETACPYIFVNNFTGKFYLKIANQLIKKPLPQAFVDRILKSVEEGIDFMPLVKAYIRFLRNPNYSDAKAVKFVNYINKTYTDNTMVQQLMEEQGLAHHVAVELATRTQTPITEEGFLVTYKVSKEVDTKWALDADGNKIQVPRYQSTIDPDTGVVSYDTPKFVEERLFLPAVQGHSGDQFHCTSLDKSEDTVGHFIRVGRRHWLESWDMVNLNDNQSCVKGLHCGNLDYIKGYQNSGTITHNVFVDPAMIGAFTDDGTGAIRVKEYFVHSSFAGPNKSIYHSSKYGSVTDEIYEEWLQEAAKKHTSEAIDLEENFEVKRIVKDLTHIQNVAPINVGSFDDFNIDED